MALPLIQRVLNTTVHSSIGTSSSQIIFGNAIDLNRRILHEPFAPDAVPLWMPKVIRLSLTMHIIDPICVTTLWCASSAGLKSSSLEVSHNWSSASRLQSWQQLQLTVRDQHVRFRLLQSVGRAVTVGVLECATVTVGVLRYNWRRCGGCIYWHQKIRLWYISWRSEYSTYMVSSSKLWNGHGSCHLQFLHVMKKTKHWAFVPFNSCSCTDSWHSCSKCNLQIWAWCVWPYSSFSPSAECRLPEDLARLFWEYECCIEVWMFNFITSMPTCWLRPLFPYPRRCGGNFILRLQQLLWKLFPLLVLLFSHDFRLRVFLDL